MFAIVKSFSLVLISQIMKRPKESKKVFRMSKFKFTTICSIKPAVKILIAEEKKKQKQISNDRIECLIVSTQDKTERSP